MLSVLSYLKIGFVGLAVISIVGCYFYISQLRSDLELSLENNRKLEEAVVEQQFVITKQIEEFNVIRDIINKQEELNNRMNKDIENLKTRFNKNERDMGTLAKQKPVLVQKAINNGTSNALRCMEIAMGSPLTEKEKNATRKSEINPECYFLANPSYNPY